MHIKYKPECKNCHTTKNWDDLKGFMHESIITDQINNCISCHKSPGDELHNSIMENCNLCHSTTKWKPSTFDHSTKFQLDKDHNTKCNTCHTDNNFKKYTCFGCHEHTQVNMLREHDEEGITDLDNCVSCHKSANEKDIKNRNNNKNDNKNNKKNDKEDDR